MSGVNTEIPQTRGLREAAKLFIDKLDGLMISLERDTAGVGDPDAAGGIRFIGGAKTITLELTRDVQIAVERLRDALTAEEPSVPQKIAEPVVAWAREGIEFMQTGKPVTRQHVQAIVQAAEEGLDGQRSFAIRWEADMRAIRRWQAGDELAHCGGLRPLLINILDHVRHEYPQLTEGIEAQLAESAPGGRELTWPDHADLVVWLLGELEDREVVVSGPDGIDATRETREAIQATINRFADAGQSVPLAGTMRRRSGGFRQGRRPMSRESFEVIRCDRCGHSTELRRPGDRALWGALAAQQVARDVSGTPRTIGGQVPFDLCPACTDSLFEWFTQANGPLVQPDQPIPPRRKAKPAITIDGRKRAVRRVKQALLDQCANLTQIFRDEPSLVLHPDAAVFARNDVDERAEATVDAVLAEAGIEK